MKHKELCLIATVVLLISAVANSVIKDDFSHIATIVLSVLGSMCLAVTIYYYAVEVKE